MSVFDILKLFVIAFVLSDITEFIAGLIVEVKMIFKSRLAAIIYNIIAYVMSCPKCFGFWFSLIYTGGDLFISASVALLINYVKMIEYKIKGGTEL